MKDHITERIKNFPDLVTVRTPLYGLYFSFDNCNDPTDKPDTVDIGTFHCISITGATVLSVNSSIALEEDEDDDDATPLLLLLLLLLL